MFIFIFFKHDHMTKALNIQLNLTYKNKKLTNDQAIGICIKVLKGINGMTKSF